MRRTIPLLACLSALAAVSLTAEAQARPRAPVHVTQDRYCLQGRIWGYPGNCQFATYEQCQASASGTNAYCGINPTYAFARQRGYY